MYEGKNIHYSSFDKKPLCSFSSKVCNQHRLNGYAFCVRHILEDPTAPFRRCSYVAKSSKQTCTQAIPRHEDREYCNNHMQVLGMLPRKEKKIKKDKNTENMLADVKIPFQDRVKSRFNINKLQNDIAAHSNPSDDPDDPYAFPDPSGDSKVVTAVVQPTTPSSAGDSPSLGNAALAKSPGDSCSSTSSIAKFYPELAEKLEKIKPKNEIVKLKDKGKDKSSRTMNSLETRIAQNRIKSKRRGTQESSSQSQSPLHSFGKSPLHAGSPNDVYSSFANHLDFERAQKTPPAYNHVDISPTEPQKSANVPGIELKRPPPSYFRQPFDRVPGATSVNSPVVTAEDKHLVNPARLTTLSSPQPVSHGTTPMEVPQATPLQSLPGLSDRIPVPTMPNAFNLDLPSSTMLPNIAAYLSAIQAKNPYLGSLPPHLLSQLNFPPSSVPFINLNSPAVMGKLNQSVVGKPNMTHSIPQPENNLSRPPPPPPLPPPLISPSGITHVFPSVCGGSTTTTSVTFTASSQQIRPPPPPYSSAVAQVLNKPPVATVTTSKPTFTKPLLNVIPSFSSSLMSAKPSKVKNVLSESEVNKRIKSEMAKKYYNAYLKRKIYNHSLLKAGIDSSTDDSSDEEKSNLLPWQPQWFCASSDEEPMDEEEDQNDVIRTTKLALLRARLRRHCSQSRKAFKGNVGEQGSCKDSVMSLIQAVRESCQPTVCAINERLHIPQPKVLRYKRRGLDRRQCLYKNDEDVQCKSSVVPCANHCLKHIMYNIDQQLFDYCTAKTADNVQCCIPVIDITHELPLCLKHAREVEDSYRVEEEEIKPKRPRKKTKPSALTRPPKKGKKKKNQRKSAQLMAIEAIEEATAMSESVASGDADMDQSGSGSDESDDGEVILQAKGQSSKPPSPQPMPVSVAPVKITPTKSTLPPPLPPPRLPAAPKIEVPKDILGDLPDSVLAANLPADLNLNKGLELPLEQASRLLEEQDFQDVLNKIPDDTFDMFSGKNGEPTKEEMDELERHLAAANMDLSFAQQSISATNDYDEQIRILASILTNQTPTLPTSMGSDVANGIVDEHAQENINAIANSLAASSAANQSLAQGNSFPQHQLPQYHGVHPNNQVTSLHHNEILNNMAASGHSQVHQMNVLQQAQQMGQVTNLQLNQIRNSHQGSPVGQISHSGSPISLQSPNSSHAGSPVHNLQTPGQSSSPVPNLQNFNPQIMNIHKQGIQAKNVVTTIGSHFQPQTPPNAMLIRTTHPNISLNSTVIGTAHPHMAQQILRTSVPQRYLIPNTSNSVRMNSLQNGPNPATLVQSIGHPSNLAHTNAVQQLSQGHQANVPQAKLIQHSNSENLFNIVDSSVGQQQFPAGNILYSVPSLAKTSIPASTVSHIIQSNNASSIHTSAQNPVTESVQSSLHNVTSSYHCYQSNHLISQSQGQISNHVIATSENIGTRKSQQTKVASVKQALTTASLTPHTTWHPNVEGLALYQNGFPSHSAQFVSDVNNGKFAMTAAAHGIQNCTDSQLLQNLTQSLVTAPNNQVPPPFDNPNKSGINSQRIAQTGTGS